ncbi:MAG: serine/threonine-protein kinase [Planctomycetota bacterium]
MAADPTDQTPPDWEAFYANYRKPGYVPGFEILQKLGGGAFGIVFQARKQSIGKDYAIKFLKLDETGDVRKGVLAELDSVRHFAQVDHPNLVAIEDRGEVDGIPYLVMNFAGSTTLKDLLPAAGTGEREELRRLFFQVSRGVAALHDHGLVHFDLKPGNVFVKGGVARVGDYGLSRLLAHSRASLSMGRGTPYYMAPELLDRRGDQRSDIYSLGVMLYEILVGRVPFVGDSEWEVLEKHRREAPEFPSTLSSIDRDVLASALAKDPSARFASVGAMLTALGVAPAGVFTSPSASLPSQPSQPRRISPQQIAAAKDKLRRAARDAGDAARIYARHAAERARNHARQTVESARAMAEAAGVSSEALDPAQLDREPLPVALARSHWHAWRARSDAKKAMAAARRPRRRGGRILLVTGFAIASAFMLILVLAAPRSTSVTSYARNPVQITPIPKVSVTNQLDSLLPEFRGSFLLGRPDWASARTTRKDVAKARLDLHLARFQAVVPKFEMAWVEGRQGEIDFHRVTTGFREKIPEGLLDAYELGARNSVDAYLRSESVVVAKGPAADALRVAGSFGLEAVAKRLQELVDGSADTESVGQRDALERFLREQTAFEGIPPMRDVTGQRPVTAEQRAARAALWRWFLWEFARDNAMLEQYRKLRGLTVERR